jgi:hypothetical protein
MVVVGLAVAATLVLTSGVTQAVTTEQNHASDNGQTIYVTFERDAVHNTLSCYAHNIKDGPDPVVYILVSVTCQVNPDGSGSGWQDIFTAQAAHCGETHPASCNRAPTSGDKLVTWNPCGDGFGASPDYRAQADGYWYNDPTNKHQFRAGGAIQTASLTVTKSNFC